MTFEANFAEDELTEPDLPCRGKGPPKIENKLQL